jgi:hypothetical protein
MPHMIVIRAPSHRQNITVGRLINGPEAGDIAAPEYENWAVKVDGTNLAAG